MRESEDVADFLRRVRARAAWGVVEAAPSSQPCIIVLLRGQRDFVASMLRAVEG